MFRCRRNGSYYWFIILVSGLGFPMARMTEPHWCFSATARTGHNTPYFSSSHRSRFSLAPPARRRKGRLSLVAEGVLWKVPPHEGPLPQQLQARAEHIRDHGPAFQHFVSVCSHNAPQADATAASAGDADRLVVPRVASSASYSGLVG